MPASDLVRLTAFALAWLAVAVRVVLHLRGGRSPGSAWLTGSVAGIAAALTVGWPPLMAAFAPGGGAGLVGLRVGQHAAALFAAVAATAFTAYATDAARAGRSVRWRSIVLSVVVAGMAGAGTVAATHVPSDVDTLTLLAPDHARLPGVAGYVVLFTVALGLCAVDVAVRCLRYRRSVTGAGMRLGLLLIGLGGVLAALYSGLRVAGTVAAALGGDIGGGSVSFALTIGAVLLLVAGSALTAVAAAGAGAGSGAGEAKAG